MLVEDETLRDRVDVFRDREQAGEALAQLLSRAGEPLALVLAVPSGGVPVAAAMARALQWPLDVAVVSKITLPWNSEAGYGAVAFDGSVLLNDELVQTCGLTDEQVTAGIDNTLRKVRRRVQRLRGGRDELRLQDASIVLVDDGLASGFTMLAAVVACRRAGASRIIVAVPTGHTGALRRVGAEADLVVCANVRGGSPYAVADAYQRWSDVPEALAELALERAHGADASR